MFLLRRQECGVPATKLWSVCLVMKRALSYLSAMMASARSKNMRVSSTFASGDGAIKGDSVADVRVSGGGGGGGGSSNLKQRSSKGMPVISLSSLERRIFDLLLAVVHDRNLGLTLRVAGGWVRDKLLLQTCVDSTSVPPLSTDAASSGKEEIEDGVRKVDRSDSACKDDLAKKSFDDFARNGSANLDQTGCERQLQICNGAMSTAASRDSGRGRVDDVNCDVESVDIDIALDKMMGEQFACHVSKWLTANNHPPASYGVIASNPDQSKHLATARMKILGTWIDFVNLRTETYTEATSRIPDVQIGTPLEDAMRRDLTINALFYNINSGQVEDFTGNGISDIHARVVRTPLAPLTTLLDDPLRALRAIRFASRLNFIFDPDLHRACADPHVHRALGAKVSRERISNEIDSIMGSAAPIHALGLLCELGLFSVVFRLPPESAYVDGIRPSPDFVQSALGCLINMDRLCHSRRKLDELHARALFDTRIARYAALLAPVASLQVTLNEPRKRAKPTPLAQYILRTELRMSTKDVAAVVGIHKSSMEMKSLVHTGCYHRAGSLAGRVKEAAFVRSNLSGSRGSRDIDSAGITAESVRDTRLAVGRVVRSAGPLWRVALQVAMITELSPARAADTYARGITSLPEELEAESAIVVSTYEDFERSVESMDLDGVWDLKPIIDGRELMQLLPRLPRGPTISKIMAAQVEELIKHPDAGAEQLREWIKASYQEYR